MSYARLGRSSAPARRRLLALATSALLLFQQLIFVAPTAVEAVAVVSPDVVISQIYGGGGNSGAVYRNDFIELFNRGTAAIDVTGWSVQYASATGSAWAKTDLAGVLQPGQYYLVQEAAGAGGTIDLPTPDASGGIAMSGTAGKVALVTNGTLLACGAAVNNCFPNPAIRDFVGYGSTANNYEGAGPTATLSNTTAALRISNGCVDADDNSADFATAAPNPRNSAAPLNSCAGGPTPTPTPTPSPTPTPTPTPAPSPRPIHEIQGGGNASPFANQVVTTTGVVTGVRSNGFFIQTPDAEADADPNTSQGIFVFTNAAPPATAATGNAVTVTGTIVEFVPPADPVSPPLTEISNSPTVSVNSTGNALPTPATLAPGDTVSGTLSLEQLEEYEGMRVRVASLTVVAPTDAFNQSATEEREARSTSNGVFYGVITGVPRPFREPGIEFPEVTPAPDPCCEPVFDANSEKIRVDSDGLVGAPRLEVTARTVITEVVGPLDYAFRSYTILPDPPAVTPTPTFVNLSATPVPEPSASELTVGSFNLERFYDNVDDAGGDVALTTPAYNNRLNKASLAIRNVLRTPDVLGVIEVENLSTLQTLASKINADAIAAGQPDPNYQAYLEEGNDVGLIDVGFLVKAARVSVVGVTQEGKDATFTDPSDGSTDTLNDRPPLVLQATVQQTSGAPLAFTVIVNHLRSLIDAEDDTATGQRVRAKRRAQAEFLANLVQNRQTADPSEPIALVGDFNAFEFNDGLVDLIGTIKGQPTPPDEVVLASPDLVNPDLESLVERLPEAEQYSFIFEGNAQVLDHVIINDDFRGRFARFAYARVDADFPESYRNDPNRPERLSDHDAPVAYFTLERIGNAAPVATDDAATTEEDTAVTVNVLTNDQDADGDQLTVTAVTQGANGSVVVGGDNTVTYTPNANFNGTDSFTYTASDGTAASNTATVQITVNAVNDPPNAVVDFALTLRRRPVTIPVLANDRDPEGDSLSVTGATQGANGSVAVNADGTVTYTPRRNFRGLDRFTYNISDGRGGTDTADVWVLVINADD